MTQSSPGNPDLGQSPREARNGRLQLGSSRGAKAKALECEVTRELNSSDIVVLQSSPLGAQPQGIQRLRDSHHQLARTLSQGFSNVEASAMTGYSPSRISILRQDPAFKELLEFYRERADAAQVDVIERLKSMSLDVLQELHDRLLNQPEEFKNSELIDFVSRLLDRSGAGPSSKTTHTERRINLTGQDLKELHEATQETTNVIEGQSRELQSTSTTEQPDSAQIEHQRSGGSDSVSEGRNARVDDAERGSAVRQTEKVEREPRQGPDLREESGSGTSEPDQ